MLHKNIFLILYLVLICSVSALGGVTGKIKGKVTDKANGDPLLGANVIILGTNFGAATDLDGNYFVINVPPGSYKLKFSFIGYESVIVTDVRVFSDKTTVQDIQLSPQTYQTKEIVISGARDVVEKDRTNTTAYISGDQIKNLPVQEVNEVLQLQTGVVKDAGGKLHIRGGRGGEIAYLIDGVPVSDQFRGGSSIGLENSWIQELQVISGTFNAEYGQAQSGVVNVVTRDGSNKFGGNVTVSVGDYISSHKDVFMNIDKVGIGETDGIFSLYGPTVLIPNMSFFSSLRLYKTEGWLYGQRRNRIEDTVPIQEFIHEASQNQSGTERLIGIKIPDSLQTGDDSFVPMNPQKKLAFYGKLSFLALKDLHIKYSLFYNNSESKSYSDSRRYSPDGQRTLYLNDYTHILNINHLLSKRTFYTLSFSYYSKNQQYYLFTNPLDPRYQGLPYTFEGFNYGGTDNTRSDITNSAFVTKLDLTSQIDDYNQIKFGGELKLHQIVSERSHNF